MLDDHSAPDLFIWHCFIFTHLNKPALQGRRRISRTSESKVILKAVRFSHSRAPGSTASSGQPGGASPVHGLGGRACKHPPDRTPRPCLQGRYLKVECPHVTPVSCCFSSWRHCGKVHGLFLFSSWSVTPPASALHLAYTVSSRSFLTRVTSARSTLVFKLRVFSEGGGRVSEVWSPWRGAVRAH